MSADQVIQLSRQTLETALWLGAPLLVIAVLISLLVNIVQVLTSLQDMTISTIIGRGGGCRSAADALDGAPVSALHSSVVF